MLIDTDSFLDQKKLTIGVVGLGFVGLPLALLFVSKGFTITGIDLDEDKVRKINSGTSYLPDIKDIQLTNAVSSGKFRAESNYHSVNNLDVIIICVPTPLTNHRTPDLSYLQEVGNQLAPRLQKGQLIVLESSTYPGTTSEVLKPILEKDGLTTGVDFHLAYSPERIDPGNISYQIEDIPKVTSGITDACKQRINDLYVHVFKKVVSVSSTEVAELTKLLENSYRFINISFINELAMFCDAMKINIWEVIEAANTKPYGFTPFYPGPGIGGHCIPVDPLYLSWKANQYNINLDSLNVSTKINQLIPLYIVEQLKSHPFSNNDLNQKDILLIGVSYKKDLGDIRESPAIPIIRSLTNYGANVSYYDPFVPELTVDGLTLINTPLSDRVIQKSDCVVILTDHSSLSIEQIVKNAKLVYDTRNVTKDFNGNPKIIRLGGGNS